MNNELCTFYVPGDVALFEIAYTDVGENKPRYISREPFHRQV